MNIYTNPQIVDNSEEYNRVDELLENYRSEYFQLRNRDYFYFKHSEIEILEQKIYNCLLYLADLTLPLFYMMDDIEYTYYNYKDINGKKLKNPKTLWLNFYRSLHEKPDKLKNKAHSLLVKIEHTFPLSKRKKRNLYEKIYK